MKTHIILYLVVLLLTTACVDAYKPDIAPAPKNIMVDGLITNQKTPYIIRIGHLKNVYDSFGDSVSGAKVTVSDNEGNTFLFLEKKKGVYESDPNVFTGVIGKTYTLKIVTKEGKVYQSSAEKLNDIPPIESITNTYKDATSGNEGFYVYISFKDLPEEGNFYRWETTFYAYKPRCGDINSCCDPCWDIYKKPDNIIISSDENYNGKLNANQEIFVVPYSSRSTAFINIVQYSTSASTYQFWKQLRKQISSVGSIFDPTPSTINGNIENIGNKDERVYGLFSASSISVTSYRIKRDYISENPKFITLPPIPNGPPPPCKPCIESDNVTKIKPFGWPN